MNLVSIIMPSYNSRSFIEEAIKSVIIQSYQNWELIIIDDCSKDGSWEIIRKYTQVDIRIKSVFLEKNGGAAKARNAGLAISKGKYIGFLDSDDIWSVDKLDVQIKFMEERNVPISFTSYEVFSESSKHNYVIEAKTNLTYKDYLKNTIIGCSTAIINRQIVGDFLFREDLRIRQDTKLWLTLLKKGYIAYGINTILVRYRLHQNSISNNKFNAALKVWNLYYNIEKLSFFKSIYYFSYYAYNAFKKRIFK
jgi:teichuronic acid biosynthesis glycosyltransferase TuaG